MSDKKLPTRQENFSERYNELVERAWLAQNSAVRWCMVIKPYGYAIWERMQEILDRLFKATGHQNAYFPLFIPKSFFSKEASHVEWFAKECAVVTHYRLKNDPDGNGVIVDPEAKLEEELIVRPTSETIIRNTYKDRIQSYRDLPLLINQRANVVRREMRTRVFLRTAEFLRQEGHTAHATDQEAIEEAEKMLDVYYEFVTKVLAIAPVKWRKSANERFAGAIDTYCIETMMQDGKALQAGTSHFLGQNFAKAFDVTFINKENTPEYVRATSRGVSTRLMGALVMSHSDDKGLVLPPALAPVHVVILPIFKTDEEKEQVIAYIEPIEQELKKATFELQFEEYGVWFSKSLTVKTDTDDGKTIGRKYNEYELQGVPLRIAVGMRDLQNGVVEIYRRDTQTKELVKVEEVAWYCQKKLEEMQTNLLAKNLYMREENTVEASTIDEFSAALDAGKFVMAHRDGSSETEEAIKEATKATIRCIPLDQPEEAGICFFTGNPSNKRVLFARAY